MVVTDDHRRRIVAQRPPHHLARVHLGAVDGAGEQFLEGQRPVAGVEEQGGEDLVPACAQALGKIATRACGVGQDFAAFQRGGQVAMTEFQRRSQLAGAGRAQPGQAGEGDRVVFQAYSKS